MLRRRLEARSSLFEEKRQVRFELREVKTPLPSLLLHPFFFLQIRRLESDAIKQHRLDHHLKSQKKS